MQYTGFLYYVSGNGDHIKMFSVIVYLLWFGAHAKLTRVGSLLRSNFLCDRLPH